MNWILNPLTQYGLTAAGLTMCLYLLYLLKQENMKLRKQLFEQQKQTASVMESLRKSLGGVESTLTERPPTAAPATPAPMVPPSINLSQRSQALRMFRRGESPAKIASSLQMTRGEVDLMIKVHAAAMGT